MAATWGSQVIEAALPGWARSLHIPTAPSWPASLVCVTCLAPEVFEFMTPVLNNTFFTLVYLGN